MNQHSLVVTFGQRGHGARHLRGTGLSVASVEQAIADDIRRTATQGKPMAEPLRGQVIVDTHVVEYRAYNRGDGVDHVGTYYPALRVEP